MYGNLYQARELTLSVVQHTKYDLLASSLQTARVRERARAGSGDETNTISLTWDRRTFDLVTVCASVIFKCMLVVREIYQDLWKI